MIRKHIIIRVYMLMSQHKSVFESALFAFFILQIYMEKFACNWKMNPKKYCTLKLKLMCVLEH